MQLFNTLLKSKIVLVNIVLLIDTTKSKTKLIIFLLISYI